MNTVFNTLITGIGATALVDAWMIVRKPLLGVAAPDYGMVGRWMAHMTRGQFRHDSIATAAAMPGERTIGWAAHYLIGIAFAAWLPALWGAQWFVQPDFWPALLVGIGTVAAPFLLMQPGMGGGIAASRSPRPAIARLHSLLTHAVFGTGLFVTASAMNFFNAP